MVVAAVYCCVEGGDKTIMEMIIILNEVQSG
jgi:hypothetical protein